MCFSFALIAIRKSCSLPLCVINKNSCEIVIKSQLKTNSCQLIVCVNNDETVMELLCLSIEPSDPSSLQIVCPLQIVVRVGL